MSKFCNAARGRQAANDDFPINQRPRSRRRHATCSLRPGRQDTTAACPQDGNLEWKEGDGEVPRSQGHRRGGDAASGLVAGAGPRSPRAAAEKHVAGRYFRKPHEPWGPSLAFVLPVRVRRGRAACSSARSRGCNTKGQGPGGGDQGRGREPTPGTQGSPLTQRLCGATASCYPSFWLSYPHRGSGKALLLGILGRIRNRYGAEKVFRP